MIRRRFLSVGILILTVVTACAAPAGRSTPNADPDMLTLLLPSRIEIIEPFTRVGSADVDAKPEWIELWLQAENVLDSPGLMIAGKLRVELYEYIPASGYSKGRRFEHWNINLATVKDQRKFWNAVTQMYEFRLGINPDRIPKAHKYVLAVTYYPPVGDRLMDEMVISRNLAEIPR